MNKAKLLSSIIAGIGNVRFSDMRKLIEYYGFRLDRVNGSHHIFVHPSVKELINLQNVKGKAKPYQIKQFLALVEKYNLHLED